MRLQYFSGLSKNLDELKAEYKSLAKVHHPDAGGDNESMKLVNIEYEFLFKSISGRTKTVEEVNLDFEVEQIFMERIQEIIHLEGILIEIVGKWIWVTGQTFTFKDVLKRAGFFFAAKKKAWFWRPDEARSYNRREMSLEEIRQIHGTMNVPTVGRGLIS